MSKYHTIIKMQPISGDMKVFYSGEHDSLEAAMNAQCKSVGAYLNMPPFDTGAFLADMEISGKLEETCFKDGIELTAEQIAANL